MSLDSKLVAWFRSSPPRPPGHLGRRDRRATLAARPAVTPLEERTLLSAAPVAGVLKEDGARPLAVAKTQAAHNQPTGILKAAEAVDSTTVRISFRSPVSQRLAPKLRYEIAGLKVVGSTLDKNGRGAVLKTAPQGKGAYRVKVSLAGSKASAATQGVATFQGKPAPRILSVKPISDTMILVTYDRPMGRQALNPANYSLKANTAQPARILRASSAGKSASVVALQTTPQSYGTYSFNVNSNITDTSGQKVFFEGRKITGNPKGAVVSVAATSSTRVVVAFNEPMADNALAPQHYTIRDPSGKALLVTDAKFDGPLGMVVVLTTAPQAGVTYSVAATNITDLQNDGLATTTNTGSFQGIAAPAMIKAAPTDPTHIVLTFSGPVGDSALAPSTYRIDKLDAQGQVIGSLPVLGARFVGGQRTVVELTTPAQEDARYRIATTSALTDAAGSPLPAAQSEVRGISGQPALLGVTTNGPNSLLLTFSRPLSDDALSPSSYVIKDATGATLAVLSAQFIGTEQRVVQLTTGPQTAEAYSIVSISARDLGGNGVPAPGPVGSFQGAPAPSLSNATPTDPTHVVLTFAGPVGDSALSPSSYRIEKLDAQGNVVGTLPIAAAAFVGGQRTVVSLTTAGQSAAPYRISTTSSLTDANGSPLPVVQKAFQGLGSQPVLVGSTSTGPTTILLTFSQPMSDDALSPSSFVIKDAAGATLPVLGVQFVGTERRIVQLTTAPQTSQTYTIVSIAATASGGGTTVVPTSPTVSTFPGLGTPGESPAVDGAPRVVGAVSLSNTEVLVSFSEPMAAGAATAAYYFIVQQNVNPESGYLQITDATWFDANHTVVKLTTLPQNELTYQVTVVAVTDVAGNSLAPRIVGIGGVVIDPTSAQFPGTPPSADADGKLTDTDDDGLPDNVEMRGWQVTVQLVDGTTTTRTVTSNPTVGDTDGDGLGDYQEANIRTDPRSKDTDDDQLDDYAEFNEIYSNPLAQDSDGDTLDDSLEWSFFKTSPIFADTDGDQLRDDAEIFSAIRNPLVADLPKTDIQVGNVDLQLDVRFTEATSTGNRVLKSKSENATLTQTDSASFSHTDSNTQKFGFQFSNKHEQEEGVGSANILIPFTNISKNENETTTSYSGSWTSESTTKSSHEAQQAYERSLQTDVEATQNGEVTREVVGASMSIALTLKSVGTLAFRVKNLVVTALFQDPEDPTNLRPIASLRPDPGTEPEDGFALGPLVPERGPLRLSSESVFPSLVESLMKNPRGLIFKIANYDIVDELGRNFAFTSQDIVERTALLSFDFGGEDADGDGEGDLVEKARVAANTGRVIDTNLDGVVDSDDHRAAFDAQGKPVGITFGDAFAAIGLTHYVARLTDGTATSATATTLTDATAAWSPNTFAGGHVVITAGRGKGQARAILSSTANALTLTDAWDVIPDGTSRFTLTQEYREDGTTPADLTSVDKLHNSYSTIITNSGLEAIWRVREVENSLTLRKQWAVLLSQGDIDASAGFAGRILKPGEAVRLAYVQDLDGDRLPASLEYMLGTVDGATDVFNNQTWHELPKGPDGRPIPEPDGIPDSIDTDHDGLLDRIETLIGWTVDLGGRGSRRVTSSGYLADSDFDDVPDGVEAPALTAFEDLDNDGFADRFNPNLVDFSTDFVTDPTNPDTDGDGVARWIYRDPSDDTKQLSDDYVEIYGDRVTTGSQPPGDRIDGVHVGGLYRVKPIYTGGAIFKTRSSPNLADTDLDGLGDGNEVRFGLDPYSAGDKDSDRDGLPDFIETDGWDVTYRSLSATRLQEGSPVTRHVTSDPFNPDTDGDGLSDFLEFDLRAGLSATPVHSNPRAADTDGDGLTDKQEFLGITVRDLGIINLDPLDADSDNDLRSDGDEAELVDVESKRWVVVTEGKAPYRVFSDPRFADADFDGLVDGEEFGGTYRTDPNVSDTDGDGRSDGSEVQSGDNPLVATQVKSIKITIVVDYAHLTWDGDNGDWSELTTVLQIRPPDANGIGGLGGDSQRIDVLNARNTQIDDRGPWIDTNNDGILDQPNPSLDDRFFFDRAPYNIPLAQRSRSFFLAEGQRFAVEGRVREEDGVEDGRSSLSYFEFLLGGLAGIEAAKTPLVNDKVPAYPRDPKDYTSTVFSYDDLVSKPLQRFYFQFDSDTFPVATVGANDYRLVGELAFTIIVG